SLASILVGEGYQSIAIHSYHNWFYRRNEVFENLGFNKYISGEFFVEPARKRYYIADSEVSEMIIEETKESAEPAFIYAVTMQNHGPYKIGYDENSIQVEGNISSNSKDILEKYAQGVFDADESLKILVEYFQKSEEPTIIVFWGDHLPALGEDYQVYRDAGFYKEDGSYTEYKEMYSTPFVIWNNYSPQAKNISLSTSFLGSYVLEMAGRRGSTYTNYLSSLFKAIQTIPRRSYYTEEGIKSSDMDDYKKLQYDILFGEGYQYRGSIPAVIDKEYFLGRGELVINSAVLKKEGQKKGLFSKGITLEIKGENFVPDCQIYINEKQQPAKFIDENHLIVNLSGELITEYNGAKIQVKLYDSLDNVIAESNCLLLSKMLQ
ncbi:MAG: LTA synthase family protein, partial [Clostridia bacterium]|nr:LTA synthase family protein [Clostridia bacterium]